MDLTTHETVVVEYALELALNDLHNLIATCPDVDAHAGDLAEIRTEIAAFVGLLDRVRVVLGR